MLPESQDPYEVLGVAPTATRAEITHAYRMGLRARHPDTRRPPASRTDDDDLQRLLAAYALLRDPARRAEYDRAVAVGRPPVGRLPIRVTNRATGTSTRRRVTSPPLVVGPVRRHG